jgi:hypothetical protein
MVPNAWNGQSDPFELHRCGLGRLGAGLNRFQNHRSDRGCLSIHRTFAKAGENYENNRPALEHFSVSSFAITSAIAQRAGDAAVLSAPGEPQVIHLDDHTKLTLLGTTYGSHQMAPGYENLRTANWIYTAANSTVVWIKEEHEPGKRPNYELLVSDRANTGCVNLEERQGSFVNDSVSLQSFVLSAFPRWDEETILRVKLYKGAASQEQFILTNPAPGTIAQWTTDRLPATKSAGDLEVTLTKLIAGAPVPYREGGRRAPTNDPANQCVHLDFDFRQNGHSTTNWQA